MLTPAQKIQFNKILEELGNSIEISKTEFDAIVNSYNAVANQLSKEGSVLSPYLPEILPQGSFLIGTTIKPVNPSDDIDIDLVCQLRGKNPAWTAYILKSKVGDQLKENRVYERLLVHTDGTRCWTLRYRENAPDEKYHMDILPCVVDSNYRVVLENAFKNLDASHLDQLAIRITDKNRIDYKSETDHARWLKSNPFGYAKWFFTRASMLSTRSISLNESIQPVPEYNTNKLPLQRVVQILKRHRDMMFRKAEDNPDKPISIIITTLASKAYKGEQDVVEALLNIVQTMHLFIEERSVAGQQIKWISNPVNEVENFADKWTIYPKRQTNFFKWLSEVKKDIEKAVSFTDQRRIQESLEGPFGKEVVDKAFFNIATGSVLTRTSSTLSGSSVKSVQTELPTKVPSPKREGFQ